MSAGNRHVGLLIGIVVDRDDPKKRGYVKLKFPALDTVSDWCPVMTPFGGDGHGQLWVPEVEDHVVVAFQHGDPANPIVLGAVYSEKHAPPGDKDERVFKSRTGHRIVLSEKSGEERIEITTKNGQTLSIEEGGGLITLKATTRVRIEAAAQVEVKSPRIQLG
ncbi:phage baseplate assembly protein V [Pendulispora brunnea]|uniref:Phage baseplate assembly protein V n=1 Tax=Pendulispora brunnea TaxID=2905690 RepID=A0ABZ2KKY0_9BACT